MSSTAHGKAEEIHGGSDVVAPPVQLVASSVTPADESVDAFAACGALQPGLVEHATAMEKLQEEGSIFTGSRDLDKFMDLFLSDRFTDTAKSPSSEELFES